MNLVQGVPTRETVADSSSRGIEIIRSRKWIRVTFGGQTIADSKNAILLRQKGRAPVYYFPYQDVRLEFLEEKGRIAKFPTDVRMDLLESSDTQTACPYKGSASYYSARIGDNTIKDVAWYYPAPYDEVRKIKDYLSFYPEKVDAIFVDGTNQK